MDDTHALVRTNPTGQPFRGRCINCGAEGMKMGDGFKECPNPSGRTQEDSVLAVLREDREDG